MARLIKPLHSHLADPVRCFTNPSLENGWDHVWIHHHSTTKRRPNYGTCCECQREAEYIAKYPNGILFEYCPRCALIETTFYLWYVTGNRLYYDAMDLVLNHSKYVEQIVWE